ncbi:unnamed protein product [Prorocentrum cordatum]|uniref:Uncharacterized protein n=1 Tax=Prorocentrum cordatum TaxID=2364126 RepID=A0ABN9WXE9_9DINO|nr:unnamed protein product [Polarella glacialis]
MEEDGRAALHAPCRARDGVQGGTAGERAPRPPLLLESLAGPGSDDGFDTYDSALGEAEHGSTALHGSGDGFGVGYPEAEQDFGFHARMRASGEAWRAALEARLRARDEAWEASLEESIEVEPQEHGEDSFVGDSEFEDLGSEHGQFLRDEFSDGSEQAAEYELARAAWLERTGSRREDAESSLEADAPGVRAQGRLAATEAAQAAILSGDLAEGLRLLEAAQVFGQAE